jgi:lipopolysaccharide biosynthesis glycosyltransferase
MQHSIFIGFDSREVEAFGVCRHSLRKHTPGVPAYALELDACRQMGLYTRPTSTRDGRLWDDISDAPMSTQFAVSRFLVPELAGHGLALFMDCDMLARTDLDPLFWQGRTDASKAVWVVKHKHEPPPGLKMDGQLQTLYRRKNWSSVCLWNVDHPSNKKLTVEMINSVPGRDLHAFSWLADDEIGELHPKYNWLVGHSDPAIDPALVHFTEGTPNMPGYEDCAYASDWRAMRASWLRSTLKAVA